MLYLRCCLPVVLHPVRQSSPSESENGRERCSHFFLPLLGQLQKRGPLSLSLTHTHTHTHTLSLSLSRSLSLSVALSLSTSPSENSCLLCYPPPLPSPTPSRACPALSLKRAPPSTRPFSWDRA